MVTLGVQTPRPAPQMDGVPGYGHGVDDHGDGAAAGGGAGDVDGTTDGATVTGGRSAIRGSSGRDAVAYGKRLVGFCGTVGVAGLLAPRTKAGGGKKAVNDGS